MKSKFPGTTIDCKCNLLPEAILKLGSAKSELGHFGDEGPQHEVTVDGFG